jgi:hypothetical protein
VGFLDLQSLIAWRNAASKFSLISLVSNVKAMFVDCQRFELDRREKASFAPTPSSSELRPCRAHKAIFGLLSYVSYLQTTRSITMPNRHYYDDRV